MEKPEYVELHMKTPNGTEEVFGDTFTLHLRARDLTNIIYGIGNGCTQRTQQVLTQITCILKDFHDAGRITFKDDSALHPDGMQFAKTKATARQSIFVSYNEAVDTLNVRFTQNINRVPRQTLIELYIMIARIYIGRTLLSAQEEKPLSDCFVKADFTKEIRKPSVEAILKELIKSACPPTKNREALLQRIDEIGIPQANLTNVPAWKRRSSKTARIKLPFEIKPSKEMKALMDQSGIHLLTYGQSFMDIIPEENLLHVIKASNPVKFQGDIVYRLQHIILHSIRAFPSDDIKLTVHYDKNLPNHMMQHTPVATTLSVKDTAIEHTSNHHPHTTTEYLDILSRILSYKDHRKTMLLSNQMPRKNSQTVKILKKEAAHIVSECSKYMLGLVLKQHLSYKAVKYNVKHSFGTAAASRLEINDIETDKLIDAVIKEMSLPAPDFAHTPMTMASEYDYDTSTGLDFKNPLEIYTPQCTP